MSHTCHAKRCGSKVHPKYLMCGHHWRMVPKRLQEKVWRTYREGQCDDKRPSEDWHEAADAAIRFVFEQEFKTARGGTNKGVKMQLVINLKDGATAKDIAAELRFQAGLIDGMKPKQAASRENTDAAEEVDDDAGDDFTAKAVKAKGGKKAKSFDEDDNAEEESSETEVVDDDEDESKTKKGKKTTIDDVNDACKIKAKESDRKTVLKILSKKFGVTSVTDLKPEQYGKVIAAMEA